MDWTVFQSLSSFISFQWKYSFLLLLIKLRSGQVSILYYWSLNNLLIQSFVVFEIALSLWILWWFRKELSLASTLWTWIVIHLSLIWVLCKILVVVVVIRTKLTTATILKESNLVLAVTYSSWMVEATDLTSYTRTNIWFHWSRLQMHDSVLILLAHGHHHLVVRSIRTNPLLGPKVFWSMFLPVLLWVGTWCTHQPIEQIFILIVNVILFLKQNLLVC